MHLVDSSTLIAILTDEMSAGWAENTLDKLRPRGGVFINQIVFSEICALFDSAPEAENLLAGVVVESAAACEVPGYFTGPWAREACPCFTGLIPAGLLHRAISSGQFSAFQKVRYPAATLNHAPQRI